jgi:hypothetical protein
MAAEVRYVGTRNRQQWTTYNYNELNIIESGIPRSLVPAFGFGGSSSTQELGGYIRMPLASNRLYVQGAAKFRLAQQNLEATTSAKSCETTVKVSGSRSAPRSGMRGCWPPAGAHATTAMAIASRRALVRPEARKRMSQDIPGSSAVPREIARSAGLHAASDVRPGVMVGESPDEDDGGRCA